MSILFALQTFDSEEIVPLNADTSDVLRVLSNLCIQAHQQLIRIVEDRLQSIIGGAASHLRSSHFLFLFIFLHFLTFSHPYTLSVPALLESETIGFSSSSSKLVASRKRANSDPRVVGGEMASLLRELGALHAALTRQALPTTQMEQVFHELAYHIAATALNNLLLRKDMCSCSRGMQIR